jgi:SAM-dependent methyltransferase
VSSTYADVDGSHDPMAAVRDQDRVDAWPQIQASKRHVRALLPDLGRVLDLGCGPGTDVVALGAGALGVDRSWSMCAEAAARGATVICADGHALPFRSGAFHGVTADRVLQHIAEPLQVVDELLRVLRPGGLLVIADPDQETLSIHVPGVRGELVDAIKALRRDIGYRNGRLISSLPAQLRERGLREVTIEPFPLVLTDPDEAFGLPTWVAFWREEGGFTDADLAEWEAGIERSRADGGFVYALTYFVVSGVRR